MTTSAKILIAVFFLATAMALQATEQDRSTPRSLIECLGHQPADFTDSRFAEFFYNKESAKVILDYKEKREAVYDEFAKFRGLILQRFPDKVLRDDKTSLGLEGFKSSLGPVQTLNIGFEATDFFEGFRGLKPEDIKILSVSNTSPVKATISVKGHENRIELVKEDSGYRIHLTDKVMKNLDRLTEEMTDMAKALKKMNASLANREVTDNNFVERIKDLLDSFQEGTVQAKGPSKR